MSRRLAGEDVKLAQELRPADRVAIDGAQYEVVSEGFLAVSGASIFDTPTVLWRAQVRGLDDDAGPDRYASWRYGEAVPLLVAAAA
jgi:hypothetical protein